MTMRDEIPRLPMPLSLDVSQVVLARADWDRLVEAVEDAVDAAAARTALAEDAALADALERGRGETVEVTTPLVVLEAEATGAHPVKAWREHRGWTQSQLGTVCGVSRNLIAQLETGRRMGSLHTLACLATALRVPIDLLLRP